MPNKHEYDCPNCYRTRRMTNEERMKNRLLLNHPDVGKVDFRGICTHCLVQVLKKTHQLRNAGRKYNALLAKKGRHASWKTDARRS